MCLYVTLIGHSAIPLSSHYPILLQFPSSFKLSFPFVILLQFSIFLHCLLLYFLTFSILTFYIFYVLWLSPSHCHSPSVLCHFVPMSRFHHHDPAPVLTSYLPLFCCIIASSILHHSAPMCTFSSVQIYASLLSPSIYLPVLFLIYCILHLLIQHSSDIVYVSLQVFFSSPLPSSHLHNSTLSLLCLFSNLFLSIPGYRLLHSNLSLLYASPFISTSLISP